MSKQAARVRWIGWQSAKTIGTPNQQKKWKTLSVGWRALRWRWWWLCMILFYHSRFHMVIHQQEIDFPVQDLETRASNDSGQGNTLPTSRCCLGTAFWRTMTDLRSEESDWWRNSTSEKAAQEGTSPQSQKTWLFLNIKRARVQARSSNIHRSSNKRTISCKRKKNRSNDTKRLSQLLKDSDFIKLKSKDTSIIQEENEAKNNFIFDGNFTSNVSSTWTICK